MSEKSEEIQINKFIREARNPSIFYRDNFYIYSYQNNDFIYADLSEEQKDFLDAIDKSKQVCLLKPRAYGITSTLALYVARIMLYQFDRHISFISPLADRSDFRNKVLQILSQSMFFEENKLTNNNLTELRYGSSKLTLHTDSKHAMRGFGPDIVIFDEASHLRTMEDMWHSCALAISARVNSKIIVTSSCDGPSSNFVKRIFENCYNEEIRFKRKLLLEKSIYKNNETNYGSRFFKLAY